MGQVYEVIGNEVPMPPTIGQLGGDNSFSLASFRVDWPGLGELGASKPNSPDELLMVRRALGSLAAGEHTVVMMVAQDGKDLHSTAAFLGLPLRVCSQILAGGLNKITQHF